MKVALAVCLSMLCWRPGRRARARAALAAARRVLLVRVDNRVGEVLLLTPLVERLAAAGYEVHLLLHPKMLRVLEGHPKVTKQWAFERRLACVRALRAGGLDVVVDCGNWATESVTTAVVARLVGGASAVLGPARFPAGWLADVPVAPLGGTRSEVEQRAHLASPLVADGPLTMSFPPTPAFAVPGVTGRYAVVNPGGRLGERRLPTALFSKVALALAEAGLTPVVTWGPGEEALARAVCEACPGAALAPATTLRELASLMRGAACTACNNTGPMHLAVAVGCPTLAFFSNIEMERWWHPRAPNRMVDLSPALARGDDVASLAEDEARAFVGRLELVGGGHGNVL